MRKVFAVVVVLVALSAGAAGEKCELQLEVITVDGANDESTPTNFVVAKGDVLLIDATGRVKVGDWIGEVDANGQANQKESPGRLRGKIGTSGVVDLGAHAFVNVDKDGPLKLSVYDLPGKYEDNTGTLSVTVTRIPACALAAAKAPPAAK